MFNRAILHLDLDAFFVSVERLRNDALRRKPLIIGGDPRSSRGVVACCSYEARAFGVHAAMPLRLARRLCPEAIVLRGDMEAYSNYSKLVTEIIEEEAPLFEKASIDEFYADLTGMDRHFGCWKWSKELRQKIIRETGLPLSSGLSVNKLVSKVGAGESKPNGARLVEAGKEKSFLAPLSVRKLPGVGHRTYKKLRFMGISNVRLLGRIPARLLEREFGRRGRQLWQQAHAIDDRPVVPYREKKSISSEQTFRASTIDMRFLRSRLTAMAGELAYELRRSQKLSACISVKIRYADFDTHVKQRRIPYTAKDELLIRHAHELLEQVYQRRQRLRLIGLRLSELVRGCPQMNLFEDSLEDERLLKTMDEIRDRFGKGAIKRGAVI